VTADRGTGDRGQGTRDRGDRGQETGERRQGTGDRRQGTGDSRQGAGERGGDRRKGTGEREQGTGDKGQGAGDRGHGTGDRGQGAAGDRGKGTGLRNRGESRGGLAAWWWVAGWLGGVVDGSRGVWEGLVVDRRVSWKASGDPEAEGPEEELPGGLLECSPRSSETRICRKSAIALQRGACF